MSRAAWLGGVLIGCHPRAAPEPDASVVVADVTVERVSASPVSTPTVTNGPFPSIDLLCKKYSSTDGCFALGEAISFKGNEQFRELHSFAVMCGYKLALRTSLGWFVLPVSYGQPACEAQEEIRARVVTTTAKANELTISVTYVPATTEATEVHCKLAADLQCAP